MNDLEIARRSLDDYSLADLRALKEFTSDALKILKDDESYEGESIEYKNRRYAKIYNLQKIITAISLIVRSRQDSIVELLADFRNQ